MAYTALYRKFRPGTFDEVQGQDPIVTTLKNQIKNNRIGHAYLFTGTRGTGKTSCAKIFARAVNCENPQDGSPCGECSVCKAIASGSALNVIEIDAASNNGVDNIREIIEEVAYTPTAGRFKVYIVDEVHMLSPGAYNALLKTLEEPPSHVIFILATTEVHKIPVTVLSRCQRYDFKRIPVDSIMERLREIVDKEGIPAEDAALRFIARAGDGSMRDALSCLEQCVSYHYGEELTYDRVLDVLGTVDTSVFSEMLRKVLDGDVVGCITDLQEIVSQGREMTRFVSDFIWYLRGLMLVSSADSGSLEDLLDLSTEGRARLAEESARVKPETVMRYIRLLSDLSASMKGVTQKRVLVEMTLICMCRPETETNKDALLDRIRVLEQKMEKGIVVTASAGASGEAPVQKRELPPALPEDLRRVAQAWDRITEGVDYTSSCLQNARPSIDEADRLVLVFTDSIAMECIQAERGNKILEDLLQKATGKNVPFSLKLAESASGLNDQYPDIRDAIKMTVEQDDEDPGFFG